MNKKYVLYIIAIAIIMAACLKNDNAQNLDEFFSTNTMFNKLNKKSIQIMHGKMLIDEIDITGYWVPQENDIAKGFKILESYLQDPKQILDREADKNQIIQNITAFDFQVIGILKGNKRIIYLNAFPHDFPQEYRKGIIFVYDGGWNYWQTEIDLTNGKIEYFSINGYA